MKKFEQKIDLSSREEMAGFLAGHFRYDTMNSWNRMTSYANDMKVYNLGLDSEAEDKIFDLMDTEEFWWMIDDNIDLFRMRHNYEWNAGFNGRSGGYLVLYSSARKPSGYKSFCLECGQKNYKTVEESGCKCGRCGKDARVNFVHPDMITETSRKGIDEDNDLESFLEWDTDELVERCRVVCDFDRLCDDIVDEAVGMAADYDLCDEEYTVTKTRKILVPKQAAV